MVVYSWMLLSGFNVGIFIKVGPYIGKSSSSAKSKGESKGGKQTKKDNIDVERGMDFTTIREV